MSREVPLEWRVVVSNECPTWMIAIRDAAIRQCCSKLEFLLADGRAPSEVDARELIALSCRHYQDWLHPASFPDIARLIRGSTSHSVVMAAYRRAKAKGVQPIARELWDKPKPFPPRRKLVPKASNQPSYNTDENYRQFGDKLAVKMREILLRANAGSEPMSGPALISEMGSEFDTCLAWQSLLNSRHGVTLDDPKLGVMYELTDAGVKAAEDEAFQEAKA